MDKRGRIAVLTNIYTGRPPDKSATGRGFLVIDFLRDVVSAQDYLKEVAGRSTRYSPFNLCIFEPRTDHSYEATYYCRGTDNIKSVGPKLIGPGSSGFANHPFSEPYMKTAFGIKEFSIIIEDTSEMGDLETKALNLLCNSEPRYPDAQMQSQSGVLHRLEQKETLWREQKLSSIFVDIGETYGTIMQTIIVVDYDGHVYFKERSRVPSANDTTTHESSDFETKSETYFTWNSVNIEFDVEDST